MRILARVMICWIIWRPCSANKQGRWEIFALSMEALRHHYNNELRRPFLVIRFQRYLQHFWPRICPMSPSNFSVVSWIFLSTLTFEKRYVRRNRRKYRNLTCFTPLNWIAAFWRKSRSFSKIFSESLANGMVYYPSKFQHHNVNILACGEFLKKSGT